MRGAGRTGGRSFKVLRVSGGSDTPNSSFPEVVEIKDLPVPPVLEPINDEWSISNFNDPVNEKDCAAYPASPYCDGDFLTFNPIGYDHEIRTNGCETCLYVYPVILFLKLQPLIICHSDPNCKRLRSPKTDSQKPPQIPYIPKGFKLATTLYRGLDWEGAKVEGPLPEFQVAEMGANLDLVTSYSDDRFSVWGASTLVNHYGRLDGKTIWQQSYGFPLVSTQQELIPYLDRFLFRTTGTGNAFSHMVWQNGSAYADWYWGPEFELVPINGGDRIKVPPPPPPPPPPDNDDRRRRRRVCCNSCNDSADNTAKLLKEIKEIKKVLGKGRLEKKLGDDSITAIISSIHRRLGVESYPITVPETLLEVTENKDKKLESNAEFLVWLTHQIDGVAGQFPVEIEIKDIDPLTEGDQKKTISLPNISESIAEMYALTIKNSVNQEVELNMLLRLAAEIIATKNAAVVTQDYARANANFLGYKANYKPRELTYNFDFAGANLDPKSKEPVVLEKLLKTVTGYVQGWQLEDKETVVGFLQKLMFSAGIIKAVFFRGKKQVKQLKREMESMAQDEKTQEKQFEDFLKEINDPDSKYNKGSQDKPQIKDETPSANGSRGNV